MQPTSSAQKTQMPRGIPYIIGNEAAERFSFYGMRALLVPFMTQYLLMGEGKATIWQHTFLMAAYFLPLLGGLLADIFWGKYKTIIRLSLFYCLGHAVLAIYESQTGLAIGLALIAVGAGGIKSCVSAHVGDQFNKNNSSLLERVFGYFYMSINFGAFISTLLTPFLLEHYGPSLAFGIPGILMFIATVLFYMGRNKFIAIPAAGWQTYRKEIFTAKGVRILLKLCVVYLFVSVFWSLYDQSGTTWVIQAQRELMNKTINLGFFQFEALPAQIQAINPLLIIILAWLFAEFGYPFVNRFFQLTYLRKMAIGFFISVVSFALIGWIEGRLEGGMEVNVGWQLLAYLIITTAEVLVAITALEFSYTQAPNVMKSFIMGVFWLTVTIGNFITTAFNELILRDVQVAQVTTGERSFFTLAGVDGIEEGLKLETDKIKNVLMPVTARNGKLDSIPLQGTFLISSVNKETNSFEILDINHKPVKTIPGLEQNRESSASVAVQQTVQVNRLKGIQYFNFFTYMMLGAAVLFLFVMIWYKEERYIQEHPVVMATPD